MVLVNSIALVMFENLVRPSLDSVSDNCHKLPGPEQQEDPLCSTLSCSDREVPRRELYNLLPANKAHHL